MLVEAAGMAANPVVRWAPIRGGLGGPDDAGYTRITRARPGTQLRNRGPVGRCCTPPRQETVAAWSRRASYGDHE